MKRSGLGANLKYIDAEDLKNEKVRIVPENERQRDDSNEPDAEDVFALRKKNVRSSTNNFVGGGTDRKKDKIVYYYCILAYYYG